MTRKGIEQIMNFAIRRSHGRLRLHHGIGAVRYALHGRHGQPDQARVAAPGERERRLAFLQELWRKSLVYFEQFECIENAIHREKRIKKWPRRWKTRLIEQFNPEGRDLYETLF